MEWELWFSKAKEAVQKLYSEGDREAVVSAVLRQLWGRKFTRCCWMVVSLCSFPFLKAELERASAKGWTL